MGRFASSFEQLYLSVREDIFKFCKLCNFEPTVQQHKLLEQVQRGAKRIAVKSGHGTGKSTIAGVVGLYRAFKNYCARTVTTAPTMRQCQQIWLRELRATIEAADPVLRRFVEVTKTRVIIGGRDDWGCELVTANKPLNAQGVHNDHLTYIVEEAAGVERPFLEQIEGTLTNDDSLLLLIGNPNLRDCGLFDCFNAQRHRWETLTFDSRESPLTSKEQIDYLADKYGIDSDVFRIRVKGEFPLADPQSIMSSEDLEACTRTSLYDLVRVPRADGRAAKQFGLDFARFGGDENVVVRRVGNAVVQWQFWSHVEPEVAVDSAFRWQTESMWKNDQCWFVPDAGGIGQGVLSKFYNAGKQVHEFHTQNKAVSQEYDNKATEAWFGIGELVKAHKLYLPKDQRLISQLAGRRYTTTKDGKLIVESKPDYVKRMQTTSEEGCSPDRADATIMAFYDQVSSGGAVATGGQKKKVGVQLARDNRLRHLGLE